MSDRLSIRLDRAGDGFRVSCPVAFGSFDGRLFFAARPLGRPPARPAEVVLCALLLPAMRLGRDLTFEDPVSGTLLANLERLQGVFAGWVEGANPIRITAPVEETPGTEAPPPWNPPARGSAAPFSGGVDSLFTVRKRLDELTHLFHIHGFDTRLAEVEHREGINRHLRTAAAELGLPLVEVETNLRELTDPIIPWRLAYGSMIAASCHLAGGVFDRVRLPPSIPFAKLEPEGVHALTDPLWSSASVRFLTDHGHVSRFDRLDSIIDWEIARRHLRVCWRNVEAAYNCGICEKCLRTMIMLRSRGVLEAFTSFPDTIDLSALDQVVLEREARIEVVRRLVRELSDAGDAGDPMTIAALHRVLVRSKQETIAGELGRLSAEHRGAFFSSEAWRENALPSLRKPLLEQMIREDPEWVVAEAGRTSSLWSPRARILATSLEAHDPAWFRRRLRRFRLERLFGVLRRHRPADEAPSQ